MRHLAASRTSRKHRCRTRAHAYPLPNFAIRRLVTGLDANRNAHTHIAEAAGCRFYVKVDAASCRITSVSETSLSFRHRTRRFPKCLICCLVTGLDAKRNAHTHIAEAAGCRFYVKVDAASCRITSVSETSLSCTGPTLSCAHSECACYFAAPRRAASSEYVGSASSHFTSPDGP